MAARVFHPKEANSWTESLGRLLEAWATASGDAELPVQNALEFLYETRAESRREFTYGEGVTLSAVHSAKGTEYDRVLVIGPWRLPPESKQQEEERRRIDASQENKHPGVTKEVLGGISYHAQCEIDWGC